MKDIKPTENHSVVDFRPEGKTPEDNRRLRKLYEKDQPDDAMTLAEMEACLADPNTSEFVRILVSVIIDGSPHSRLTISQGKPGELSEDIAGTMEDTTTPKCRNHLTVAKNPNT